MCVWDILGPLFGYGDVCEETFFGARAICDPFIRQTIKVGHGLNRTWGWRCFVGLKRKGQRKLNVSGGLK